MSKSMPGAPPALDGFSYVRPLGVGGFADVFLFEQNMPRRSVAVKVLLKSVVDNDVIRMFNTEADVMARLSAHPSVLTVYTASISSDGRPYIVMEYCPASYATRFRKETIPVAEVLHLGVKIASALETAHRAGLLHRDIKPSNLLVNGFGTPVLADFGIATSLAGSSLASSGNQLFAMSVPWSAPEVVGNEVTGSVASEIWGLGSTLYTLIAGRSPFEADGAERNSAELLSARISKGKYTAIDRADVPHTLQTVLARTMQKDPRKRQQSMAELADELRFVQYELGLMPTALEVADDGWDTGATGINFNNASVRGPIITTVAHPSTRKKTRATPPPTEPETQFAALDSLDESDVSEKSPGVAVGLVVTAAVIALLAIAAIVGAVAVGSLQ